MGTTEGDITDDLQSSWEIDYQLCCTCLDYKPRDTNYRNIQYTQSEALRIATGCHKMSSVVVCHRQVRRKVGQGSRFRGSLMHELISPFVASEQMSHILL